MSGSQVGTALAGTMDSASIARLVQQLMSTQNLGGTTGATQSGTGATTGTSGQSTNLGSTNTAGGSTTGTDQTAGLQSNDYATMLQQLLALLYGRGGTSGASGGSGNGGGGSEGGGVGGSGGVG